MYYDFMRVFIVMQIDTRMYKIRQIKQVLNNVYNTENWNKTKYKHVRGFNLCDYIQGIL